MRQKAQSNGREWRTTWQDMMDDKLLVNSPVVLQWISHLIVDNNSGMGR